jgi:hypothetical protein
VSVMTADVDLTTCYVRRVAVDPPLTGSCVAADKEDATKRGFLVIFIFFIFFCGVCDD